MAILGCVLLAVCAAGAKVRKPVPEPPPPDILLQGGRKLTYERSYSTERDVRGKPGFWTKVVNVIAGEPDTHFLVRPYAIVIDSTGRMIVTDPGAGGVHIFDIAQHKYKFIERQEKSKDPMFEPQCLALDAAGNIYVTDSAAGKIFVFNRDGKFQHAIGSLKGGEGYFKRPTGIAVDSAAQRIYVTDTLRDSIFVLNLQGQVLQTIGQRGSAKSQFNFPTEVLLHGQELAVVDAMNFRIQFFDRSGAFQSEIGHSGDRSGEMFRPKGIGVDSEGHYYIVDGLWSVVQVFDHEGRLLYYFGGRGTAPGEFQLPVGLFIDHEDRIFVVDSYNRRIQVFHYYGLPGHSKGAQ